MAERALKHFLAEHGGSAILRTHPDGSAEVISRSLAHFGHPHHSRESAVTPARPMHVTLHSRVNLDGRVLSQGVERHIVHKHQFAHGTADHDGRAGMPHVDYMSIA